MFIFLLKSECVNRVKHRGLVGRVKTKKYTHQTRKAKSKQHWRKSYCYWQHIGEEIFNNQSRADTKHNTQNTAA